jgi:signal recognition particle GTPase
MSQNTSIEAANEANQSDYMIHHEIDHESRSIPPRSPSHNIEDVIMDEVQEDHV